jgi:hypothetical protein
MLTAKLLILSVLKHLATAAVMNHMLTAVSTETSGNGCSNESSVNTYIGVTLADFFVLFLIRIMK